MTLPKDLQTYCKKKILKHAIPCAILTFAFATILILWGNIIFNTDNKAFQVSCYIVFMIIPFAITGVPHKLIDSTYYGTVKKIDIVTTADNDSSVKPTREHLYLKNTIYLSIEKTDGKIIYKKAYSGKTKLQQNLNTYHEGDLVFHLYGTNAVVVLPNSTSTTVHCAVCGSSNNADDDSCRNCGHSLIKNI
ncbi:MAG: hypothetical protein J6S14_08990 [Clostridia bacterium]|nr:hypothetical protein [Clostridia bacterium]